ncbi:hypothetical protein ACTFSJ_27555 [Bacillus cereus group sp. MYBK12-2]|uniref:hypothetical protein n=1 Tax=Bacillus cereus group sp. MYBK12-2 TaxID=3450689 RepID=UPI0032F0E471|nr:hypothetical protein [Bacillus pacificus]HDR7653567.1 hypothetical protein [Bacillus pacificus]
MLVKDVLSKIEQRELSIKGLAEQYGLSDRSIQNKIKGLGFQWNSIEGKYEYKGEDLESTLNLNSDDAFKKKSRTGSTGKRKPEPNKSDSENKVEVKTEEQHGEIKSKSNVKAQKKPSASLDEIDRILSGGGKKKSRKYRGFYFDLDLLEIVDSVEVGDKSDLINECLRKVFEEKGLV